MCSIKKYIIIPIVFVLIGVIFIGQRAAALTVKEEEDLSRQVMREVLKQYELIDDPVIVEYVNARGQQLVAYLPEKLFAYKFYVINTDSYNAFAIPAGHIFINSGLMIAMDSEDELMGILSHEIAHVYCRHISQKIEQSKKTNLATLAGIAAGVLVGARGDAEAGKALTYGSMAASASAQLAYSREDEVQADQQGLVYLTKAGYSGEGLLEILKKIRNKQWFGSDVIPTYLTTHPAVEDRIAYIDTWLAGQAADSGSRGPRDNEHFQRIHTRLLTQFGDEATVLANLEAAVAAHPDDPNAHHRYGLILARVGRRAEAIGQIQTALEKRAFDPYMLGDLGRIYYLDGQLEKAHSLLESVYRMKPGDPDCLEFLGRTNLELGQFQKAADYFQALVKNHPEYKQGYYFLGQALGKQENLADAHYYLGLYAVKSKDRKSAILHLQRALKLTEDAERRRQIETLLGDLTKNNAKQKN